MKIFLTLFIALLLFSCKVPPCGTCGEGEKKYKAIQKKAQKMEKKMNKEAKKGKA